jgi:anti-sigma B factor antagonist
MASRDGIIPRSFRDARAKIPLLVTSARILNKQLRQLLDDGTDKILVNLTDVTQLDSSSISTIVRGFVSLQLRGASLKLLRPRGNVRLVLETLHLLDAIPSAEDEAQAIPSFC